MRSVVIRTQLKQLERVSHYGFLLTNYSITNCLQTSQQTQFCLITDDLLLRHDIQSHGKYA